jgi:uncharacterized protein (TIGR00730 family)
MIKRICIFCGSSTGNKPVYVEAARAVGRLIVEKKLGIVYGGGSVGLMGALADEALAQGGDVIGVIPQALFDKELGHAGLHKLHIVESMHKRKSMMADLADAFLALPGGFGTFEELFEIITWSQLGIHAKPVGLLNVAGYYDPLLEMCDQTIGEGFVRQEDRMRIISHSEPDTLINQLLTAQVPETAKWLRPAQA